MPNIYERTFDRPFRNIEKKHLPDFKEQFEEMDVYQGKTKEEYAERLEHVVSPEVRKTFETACAICEDVQKEGGLALLVGGSVRDEVLGLESRDFDIEIYGLQPHQIEKITFKHGKVKTVGKAFGILKLGGKPLGCDIDVSLPRTHSRVGELDRDFGVHADPDMTIKDAARRRDFTFNALSKNPLTGEIYDPFGGVKDLQQRVLRITDVERFKDDPARLFRGAQFVGRFGLRIDAETLAIMQEMVPELKHIAKERIREEWDKLLLKSKRPSMGLQALMNIGIIHEMYPELAALPSTDQEFEWHPEGDVWTHTLMVVDAARDTAEHHALNEETAKAVLWGALCHDLGKPGTTEFKDGRVRSHAHDIKGAQPTEEFLDRIGVPEEFKQKVIRLVIDHLTPNIWYLNERRKGEKISDGAFRKLAKRVHPATIEELTYVAEADSLGRGPFLDPEHARQFLLPVVTEPFDGFAGGEWARRKARELDVMREPPQPILRGRDLIDLFHFTPGKSFGEIISLADACRDDLGWTREQVLGSIAEHETIEKAIEALSFSITHK